MYAVHMYGMHAAGLTWGQVLTVLFRPAAVLSQTNTKLVNPQVVAVMPRCTRCCRRASIENNSNSTDGNSIAGSHQAKCINTSVTRSESHLWSSCTTAVQFSASLQFVPSAVTAGCLGPEPAGLHPRLPASGILPSVKLRNRKPAAIRLQPGLELCCTR